MSKFTFFTRQKNRFKELQKKTLLNLPLCKKHLNLIIVILIVGIGIVYLLQMNHMSVKGYEIKDLENRIQDLEEYNKKLQLQIDEKQSLSYINDKLADLQMVDVGRVEYLSAKAASVAVK